MENYKIKNILLEAIFPSVCVSCKKQTHKEGIKNQWLCRNCEQTLKPSFKTICHFCTKEVPLSGNFFCAHSPTFLESTSFLFNYKDKKVKSLIHALKYRYITNIINTLSPHILKERANLLRIPTDIIVPLPLHARKLRERGFNQAELLGLKLNKVTGLPLNPDILKKYRPTPAQMKIKNPARRQKNIEGVFKVVKPEKIKYKNILLVDDVITTGATLEEAAKILVLAGAKNVYAFALAKD